MICQSCTNGKVNVHVFEMGVYDLSSYIMLLFLVMIMMIMMLLLLLTMIRRRR